MKHPRAVDSSLHPAVIPAAVIASGLIAPLPAWTAPGDLDPGFGDVGRVALDLAGAAWSIEAEQDGYLLTGAQPETCSYYYYCSDATDFNLRLLEDGSLDGAYAAAELEGVVAYDSVLQPDGKSVKVGERGPAGETDLAVYRLMSDGSLDSDFGVAGITTVSDAVGFALTGRTVALDPDGKITVAGIFNINRLLVARLLPDGAVDSSFATGGVFTTDAAIATGIQPGIVRLSDGSYRLTAHVISGEQTTCSVLALTTSGAIDTTFGVEGTAAVETTGSSYCSSIALGEADTLYVAGLGPTGGFIARLLASGDIDPSFIPSPVVASMLDVTAIAKGPGGIFVAGHDSEPTQGLQIVRLQADGPVDPAYGSSGIARIEFTREFSYVSTIHDLKVLSNGALAVAGGHGNGYYSQPFAARLLGDGAGGGPGVLAMETSSVDAAENGQAVLKVRRVGGSTGSVSVDLEAREVDWYATPAVADQDFVSTPATLSWADGDASEREFIVSIPADEGLESIEAFAVTLVNPQGGAGVGLQTSAVTIRGDGYPAGMFSIQSLSSSIAENSNESQFVVYREDYSQGTVSVIVTPVGGTASNGSDYDAKPVTLTWSDGDTSARYVGFDLVSDSADESPETLIAELSDAEGGAMIGRYSSAQVTVTDAPQKPNLGNSGGGSFDLLLAAVLGLCAALRRRLRSGVVHTGHWLDAVLIGPQRLPGRRRNDSR